MANLRPGQKAEFLVSKKQGLRSIVKKFREGIEAAEKIREGGEGGGTG